MAQFYQDALVLALDLHNNYRTYYGVPPLELDSKLCGQAEEYASSVANGMKYSVKDNEGVGWNLYKIETAGPRYDKEIHPTDAIREAMTSWYSHSNEYNWKSPLASSTKAKLFSQIVWKSSTHLGVGVASGGEGDKKMTIVVTFYDPKGNTLSDHSFIQNVLRPRGRLRLC